MPFPLFIIGVFTVIVFSTLAFQRRKRKAHPRHAKDAANPKRHKAEYVPRGVFFRGHVNTTDEDFAYLKSWSAQLDFTVAQQMFAGPRDKMEDRASEFGLELKNGMYYDSYRHRLNCLHASADHLKSMLVKLNIVSPSSGRGRDAEKAVRMGKASAVRSRADGIVQAMHCDLYDSYILAVMDKTMLIFWNVDSGKFNKLVLKEGDFVVFNRQFIHCGGTYAVENRRIHAYLLNQDDKEGNGLKTDTHKSDTNGVTNRGSLRLPVYKNAPVWDPATSWEDVMKLENKCK